MDGSVRVSFLPGSILTAADALWPAPICHPSPQQQTQLYSFSDPNFYFLSLTHTSQTWGKGLNVKSTACNRVWGKASGNSSSLPPESMH